MNNFINNPQNIFANDFVAHISSPEERVHTVFVYGTLKNGHANNKYFLQYNDAEFVGEATSLDDNYYMVCNGAFPMIKEMENNLYKVRGEVYKVDDYTLTKLDMLESNGMLYTRKQKKFKMFDGSEVEAWVYIYNGNPRSFGSKNGNLKIMLDNQNKKIVEWSK
jgi:gamma-glutamylcyclotransferase (GGCT)/AIG2-like uncharacterized protein YtfP